MVSIEPETGDVVAMVGGYSFGYEGSQFNRCTQAMRQPGSSFKPILYSAALDHGFTAGSIILDAPILLINEMSNEPWRPRNFEGGFEGPMRLNRRWPARGISAPSAWRRASAYRPCWIGHWLWDFPTPFLPCLP